MATLEFILHSNQVFVAFWIFIVFMFGFIFGAYKYGKSKFIEGYERGTIHTAEWMKQTGKLPSKGWRERNRGKSIQDVRNMDLREI